MGNNQTMVLDKRAPVLQFSEPQPEDGADMWELVKETGFLDENSSYTYLMMCKMFADTCVVAKADEELVGFVTAFKPPETPDAIFVWQVAVDQSQRGKGFGKKLLTELLKSEGCKNVRYLEATINPSNKASQGLFKSMAKDLNTDYEVKEFLAEDLFPGEGHEAELKYRIGPFQTTNL